MAPYAMGDYQGRESRFSPLICISAGFPSVGAE